ncbi:MAG: hypothetical protein ACTH2Y_09055 [Corynebacterium sp.]|uniref:hypothetical protein n=1 Tax=unclassified Corynebacterium TaxID=2624378 RepID=UPI0026498E80|nr:hypothetical protein [Corynebacterium sp.]MDN5582348.1 hypothetical protein [Corynebacterium sp.]MDN5720011.1 hypothetical protein [Corynebacterium sp.]MDN6258560.1 hypothetical protein [Corynebacterium sp.]MDN6324201.1 hypothetical protein [Corynebacterium sp.]MDN6386884.1 hypothetical protein [Corynebacterium sp.]
MPLRSRFVVATAVAAATTLGLTACGDSSDDSAAPETVTQVVTQTPEEASPAVEQADVPAATSEAAPVEDLVIPEGLEGMNAQLAYERLTGDGFTGVNPTSVDPSRAMPVLYNNWTVTSIEPAPGTTVPSDSTIILNMTKE